MIGLPRNIVIVGGGTAGWMAAAALSTMIAPNASKITLIESDQIGTVGVGEATVPDIKNFNNILGLDEADFLKATHGTFKLGIEFIDWGRKGERYLHPFGNHGVDMNGVDFHQYWLYDRANGNPAPIEHYSLSAVAAKADKFILPEPNPKSILSQIGYAYHFDATLYAAYLRTFAETRGVKRVEGKVIEVAQDPETGFITTLTLESGLRVSGDMFFDCTGFRALLIDKTLGVDFKDWSHWLPCNAAQAIACEHAGPLRPYTMATAKSSGWQWRIPTQYRTGNGHIYCTDFISDDTATDTLLAGLDGAPIGSPRQLRFTTGHREMFWDKNCVALGLSAGFLEPLESTSIYLIQIGIARLLALFPDSSMPEVVRDEYNRMMAQQFEQVRDFLILHYVATERDDSPFWDYCRNMNIPDSLAHKMALFKATGRAFRYEEELFSRPSWVAVFLGQDIIPDAHDPFVGSAPPAEVARSLASMRGAMQNAVQNMPSHADFIASYCPAS